MSTANIGRCPPIRGGGKIVTTTPTSTGTWAALAGAITEEGLLGYVQPVADAPGGADPDKTEVYGIGAVLLAGTEVYKMVAR